MDILCRTRFMARVPIPVQQGELDIDGRCSGRFPNMVDIDENFLSAN